jgi:hypothetical protein
LSPEENLVAMNLNNWFIEWEKDLLIGEVTITILKMIEQTGDNWDEEELP